MPRGLDYTHTRSIIPVELLLHLNNSISYSYYYGSYITYSILRYVIAPVILYYVIIVNYIMLYNII